MVVNVNVNVNLVDEKSEDEDLEKWFDYSRSGHTSSSSSSSEDADDYSHTEDDDEVVVIAVDDPDCVEEAGRGRRQLRRNLAKSHKSAKYAKTHPHQHHPVDAWSGKSGKSGGGAKSAKSAGKSAKYQVPAGKSDKTVVKCTNPPTYRPTMEETPNPTRKPSVPTPPPTLKPTEEMTPEPTPAPTPEPTPEPTKEVTDAPTRIDTDPPTLSPTPLPTPAMTPEPTTQAPTLPDETPASSMPTYSPIAVPVTASPVPGTASPIGVPVTASPVAGALSPTTAGPITGTASPTAPTTFPTYSPVSDTASPVAGTLSPTISPIAGTSSPAIGPIAGTLSPTVATLSPTSSPVAGTVSPAASPIVGTLPPTLTQTASPTSLGASPSAYPSLMPSNLPSVSANPSSMPSSSPSVSANPSTLGTAGDVPSGMPSNMPSNMPSETPSGMPSALPSVVGTSAPVGSTTSAPTSVPDGANYFRGFEQGDFPFVLEQDDPIWTTTNDDDEDLVWELTTERVNSGVYSIKSPVLENDDKIPSTANVTMDMPDYGIGALYYSVLASIQMPFDQFEVYVDGVSRSVVTDPMTEFEERVIQLGPGPHRFDFVYKFNPSNVPAQGFPPASAFPDRIGAVFIDDVYFVPIGNIPANSNAPTPVQVGEPCVPLDPNPDSFEDGTFPSSPWSTAGADGVWAVSTEKAYDVNDSGITSLRSPNLDGTTIPSVSNATLEICNDFLGGVLRLQVYPSVIPPRDIFIIYIDGEPAAQLVDVHEWTPVALGLQPGPHRIDFSYQYNSFGIDPLPPSPVTREGGVWIDEVTIEGLNSPTTKRKGGRNNGR
mmetsp:Transcript_9622/g.21698  ORF Transcript_9622/g.21698 Transcript_9622/m.21698 type:complete len:825 (+) Transcript_9622:721-3195(+)